jgi:RNA polymerase-binding transcription factor DksA
MTISGDGPLHTLRLILQAQAERHTDELTRLTVHGTDPEHNGLDRHTVAALTESARQALADITEALKRMSEGTYGLCQHCRRDIPVERLQILPQARFCVPCQQTRGG